MSKIKDIGPVSAYALAVAHGYQGTEEEWAALQAQAGENARRAETAADSAAQSAQSAENAAARAGNAVLFTTQELDEDQQAQARKNISAAGTEEIERLDAGKIDKNQGLENARKILWVDKDGAVTTLALGSGLAIQNGMLVVTSSAAAKAICGQALCGTVMCGEE